MPIINKQFEPTKLEEEREARVISVKLNRDELNRLFMGMKLLQQEKDSTCLKQLAWLGLEVILDKKNELLLTILSNNLRRNERLGIMDVEPPSMQK